MFKTLNKTIGDVTDIFAIRVMIRSITIKLAYLKDSNAAAHSVDSDIFQSSDSSLYALQDLT